jgi:hypothetical protein
MVSRTVIPAKTPTQEPPRFQQLPLFKPGQALDGPQGRPLNTNGGDLSYIHSGMYALQESVRQMRGTAPTQIPGAKISVCYGVGGMFAASGTIMTSNEAP